MQIRKLKPRLFFKGMVAGLCGASLLAVLGCASIQDQDLGKRDETPASSKAIKF